MKEYHIWARIDGEWILFGGYREQWNIEDVTLEEVKEWLRESEDDSRLNRIVAFTIYEG